MLWELPMALNLDVLNVLVVGIQVYLIHYVKTVLLDTFLWLVLNRAHHGLRIAL
jgi:hypothetical protein